MIKVLESVAKRILPELLVVKIAKKREQKAKQKAKETLPEITEDEFRKILTDHLHLRTGDLVMVHSGLGSLRRTFPFEQILPILLETIGERGTILFPTYPQLGSYDFLCSGKVFDLRNSRSFTGGLTEAARLHPRAVRSLHPTKSVAAIGPLAEELCRDHHQSPYPYGAQSPYYKLTEHEGKIVGLGVSTARLSFVHTVDDALQDDFPVFPYHEKIFSAPCLDAAGNDCVVETYAHDMAKMVHDVPPYMKAHIAADICRDFELFGAPFFFADAKRLFAEMVRLARDKTTIYPPEVYKP